MDNTVLPYTIETDSSEESILLILHMKVIF